MKRNQLIEKLRPIARDLDDLDRWLSGASSVVSSCGEPMPAEHVGEMSRRASAALDMVILDLDRPLSSLECAHATGPHDESCDLVVGLEKQIAEMTDAINKRNEVDRAAAFVAPHNSTVRELIGGILQTFGFDGLYHDNDCGCEIDDLAPCGEYFGDCKPGHKIPCDPETCAADGCCPFHIGAR